MTVFLCKKLRKEVFSLKYKIEKEILENFKKFEEEKGRVPTPKEMFDLSVNTELISKYLENAPTGLKIKDVQYKSKSELSITLIPSEEIREDLEKEMTSYNEKYVRPFNIDRVLPLKISDNVHVSEIRKAMLHSKQFDCFECSVSKFKEMQAYFKEDSLKVCENGDLFLFGKDLVVR